MLKKALPFSFSESAGIVNGSFESQKTAKFVQKSADSGAKNTPFQAVYHLRINHKPRVGGANRSLTYAWTARMRRRRSATRASRNAPRIKPGMKPVMKPG
jgi:hypothetical protein